MTFTIIPFSPPPYLFIASFLMTIKLIRKPSCWPSIFVSTAHFFRKLHVLSPLICTLNTYGQCSLMQIVDSAAAKVGGKCTLIKESMINFSFPPTKDKGWFANWLLGSFALNFCCNLRRTCLFCLAYPVIMMHLVKKFGTRTSRSIPHSWQWLSFHWLFVKAAPKKVKKALLIKSRQ